MSDSRGYNYGHSTAAAQLGTGFGVTGPYPLDARYVVPTLNDFKSSSTVTMYKGMLFFTEDDSKLYKIVSMPEAGTSNPTGANCTWEEIGAGGSGSGDAGTLNTNITSRQTPNASESLSGSVSLHKVSKTGDFDDLNNKLTQGTNISISNHLISAVGYSQDSSIHSFSTGLETQARNEGEFAAGLFNVSNRNVSTLNPNGVELDPHDFEIFTDNGIVWRVILAPNDFLLSVGDKLDIYNKGSLCGTFAVTEINNEEFLLSDPEHLLPEQYSLRESSDASIIWYGKTASDTITSIGVGTDKEAKNAIEIFNNGATFVNGVGGYDGTNPSQSMSLQLVISELPTQDTTYSFELSNNELYMSINGGSPFRVYNPTISSGQNGVTPSITATASVSNTVGTPSVTVTKTGTDASPSFAFAFSNLKGSDGTSAKWFTGTAVTGTTSNISQSISGSKAGDMYLNTSNSNVYKATAANTWDYVCNIKGATGPSGTLNTDTTLAQSVNSSEPLSGNITLHKIAKTGDYGDLSNRPTLFSGSYNDLTNKPTIPVNTDQSVAQTNDTSNAQYRVLLSNSANDSTETSGVKKSVNLQYNPSLRTLTNGDYCFGSNSKRYKDSGWYKIAEFTYGNASHGEGLLFLTSSYNSRSNISYIFSVSRTFANSLTYVQINQLSGLDKQGLISKVAYYKSLVVSLSEADDKGAIYVHVNSPLTSDHPSYDNYVGELILIGCLGHDIIPSLGDLDNTKTDSSFTKILIPVSNKIVSEGFAALSESGRSSNNVWTTNGGTKTLGTAAEKDVPASGDASSSQVVLGNDSRLTDTKNTAGIDSSSSKMYLIGSTTAPTANTDGTARTYTNSNVYAQGGKLYANKLETGMSTNASGTGSHAEGDSTTADGIYSHAEGSNTVAHGIYSHAGGYYTNAAQNYQTVIGKYNIVDTNSGNNVYAFIIGNGTSTSARSNALTVNWNGDLTVANTVSATNGFFQTSDIRKKNIISGLDLLKCYDLVNKCQTILYTLKDDNAKKLQIGVIAQEVKEYFPELVSEDENGMLSVDYARLTVILMSIVKDLSSELQSVKSDIEQIKNKLMI